MKIYILALLSVLLMLETEARRSYSSSSSRSSYSPSRSSYSGSSSSYRPSYSPSSSSYRPSSSSYRRTTTYTPPRYSYRSTYGYVMPSHIYSGSMYGLGYGYYMPYYGQTYYLSYNPHNYYGQGDICLNAGACGAMTRGGGGIIGTIVGLCFFCVFMAVVCAVVAKSKGGPSDD